MKNREKIVRFLKQRGHELMFWDNNERIDKDVSVTMSNGSRVLIAFSDTHKYQGVYTTDGKIDLPFLEAYAYIELMHE